MYSRFLKETSALTSNQKLLRASEMINKSGILFTGIGKLFIDAETASDLDGRIKEGGELLLKIANLEEEAFQMILDVVSRAAL